MDKEGSYGGKSKVKKPASISKSKLMKIDIDKVAKVTPDSAKNRLQSIHSESR